MVPAFTQRWRMHHSKEHQTLLEHHLKIESCHELGAHILEEEGVRGTLLRVQDVALAVVLEPVDVQRR